MEEGGVGDAQLSADHRIVLVSRAADGVEGAVLLLQLPGGDVQLAGGDLVFEQLERLPRGEPAALAQGRVGCQRGSPRCSLLHGSIQGCLDDGHAIEGHADQALD